MARIHMKSTEIRRGFRAILDHIIRGDEIVVEHYDRPVALITPYREEEQPMAETRRRYTTADDAKNDIRIAIEGGGVVSADDFDVDAIYEAAYEWRIDHDDQGNELLNTGGFEQVVDNETFWQIVEDNDKN